MNAINSPQLDLTTAADISELPPRQVRFAAALIQMVFWYCILMVPFLLGGCFIGPPPLLWGAVVHLLMIPITVALRRGLVNRHEAARKASVLFAVLLFTTAAYMLASMIRGRAEPPALLFPGLFMLISIAIALLLSSKASRMWFRGA